MPDPCADLSHIGFEGKPTPRPACRRTAPAGPGHRTLLPARGEGPGGRGEAFARWVLRQAGLNAAIYRREGLERRVAACLRLLKVPSTEAARNLLRDRPALVDDAVGALLIGVTEFFRDAQVFETLRTVVVPALARREGPIAIWSAGCASGAELYSVAILLAEAGLLERSRLVGTDCRADAIARARAATYQPPVPPLVPVHYVEAVRPGGWRLVERLRAHVEWRVSDVSREIQPGPWSLILWRNAAIYIETEPADRIAAGLVQALRPGGFLVVGKAERVGGLEKVARCVYRSTGSEHGCY